MMENNNWMFWGVASAMDKIMEGDLDDDDDLEDVVAQMQQKMMGNIMG